jgi:hypothetical protein
MASVSRRVRRAVCRGPSTVKVLRKRWARYRQKHEIPVSLGGLRGTGRELCPSGEAVTRPRAR